MVHAPKEDERYFLDTGYFPEHLRANSSSASLRSDIPPNLSHISQNVCREFVKRQCTRGSTCKFYHPTPQELEILLSQQKPTITSSSSGPPSRSISSRSTDTENVALKSRVNQLERLLADACYCMTLAVGDQNPAISALMKTISEMAPESALANQAEDGGGDEMTGRDSNGSIGGDTK